MVDNEGTPAATYVEGYDRETMVAQQLQEQISRAVLQDPTATTPINLPRAIPLYLLGWNAAGTAIENKYPINPNDVAAAAASAAAAAGSATSASNSAIAAAASAASIPSKATQSNAEAGTSDSVYMTPLQVKNEVQKSGAVSIPAANVSGIPAQVGFGSWVDKSSSYGAQQAATDGFIVAINPYLADITLYSDANANPTTIRSKFAGNGTQGFVSVFSPIKKGDYWKITVSSGTPTVYWIPLGA